MCHSEQQTCPQFPQFPQVFPMLLKQLGEGTLGVFPKFPSSPVIYTRSNWGNQESRTYARFGRFPSFSPVDVGAV
jgi:hypothetical protein